MTADVALLTAGSILALVAAVVHVGIFVLESVLWPRPGVWRRFGLRRQEDADTVHPMAFNQGFYNLFLAVGAGAGVALLASRWPDAGLAVALFACASMVLAAVVLLVSSPKLARAAVIQGAAPLVGGALLVSGALLR